MPKQKNIDSVSELKTKVDKSKAIFLADYRGLTHKQLEELHKAVKKVEGEFVVIKNSLLRRSLNTEYRIPDTSLTGPTAALFAYSDELSPLKELFKFIKAHSLPKMKLGLMGAVVYDESQVATLAKLPSQEILRGQLVSGLSGPVYGLVYALNGNLQKLVTVLGQIKR